MILISACGIFCIALVFILNKYSIPIKQERLNNMITYQGETQLDKNDVVNEVNAIFKKQPIGIIYSYPIVLKINIKTGKN